MKQLKKQKDLEVPKEPSEKERSQSHMALMWDLVDKEPTCFEEEIKQNEWDDSIFKEYQSIIKNDV